MLRKRHFQSNLLTTNLTTSLLTKLTNHMMAANNSDRTPIFSNDLISLGAESKVYANVISYQGNEYIHVRVYLDSYANDGTMVPTKTGACLKVDEWNNLLALRDTVNIQIQQVSTSKGQIKEIPMRLTENSKFYLSITYWKEDVKVHIRVFEQDGTKLIPQKKGIALSVNEWDCLIAKQNDIQLKLSNLAVPYEPEITAPATPPTYSVPSGFSTPTKTAEDTVNTVMNPSSFNPWHSTPKKMPTVHSKAIYRPYPEWNLKNDITSFKM